MKKYYYSYSKAQKHYEYILKVSRTGIDMTIDELYYWDEYFKDKLKSKNQPIKYVNQGHFFISCETYNRI